MNHGQRIDEAANVLASIESTLDVADSTSLSADEIAAATGRGLSADPALARTSLDQAANVVQRLQARLAALSAAFARERLRYRVPTVRDQPSAARVDREPLRVGARVRVVRGDLMGYQGWVDDILQTGGRPTYIVVCDRDGEGRLLLGAARWGRFRAGSVERVAEGPLSRR